MIRIVEFYNLVFTVLESNYTLSLLNGTCGLFGPVGEWSEPNLIPHSSLPIPGGFPALFYVASTPRQDNVQIHFSS
jgi:hypothetical protein